MKIEYTKVGDYYLRFDLLMKQFVEKENITEELKVKDQLKWFGLMNNIKFIDFSRNQGYQFFL